MSFKISSRFIATASSINDINVDKFSKLLLRIIQKLHIRDERLFTIEEETQLKTLFNVSDETLRLVIDACCYIFEQAAFSGIGPEPLYETLLESGIDEQHSKVIGRLWAAEALNFINKLKLRTLGSKSLLETRYHLNLIMADSVLSKQHEPTAIFEFTLSNPEHISSSSSSLSPATIQSDNSNSNNNNSNNSIEKVCTEFSHQELYSLFNDLERIQIQLDNLSGQV